MFKHLIWVLSTLITSSAFAASQFDIMLPCHGCADWKMKKIAQHAATQSGQTIYVVDNRSGKFYINEYYVDFVDPGSLSTSNDWLVDMTRHTPGTPLSNELASRDAQASEIFDTIIQPYTITSSVYTSAFKGVDDAGFVGYLTNDHYRKNLENFSVFDAIMKRASSNITVTLNLEVLSFSATFADNPILTFNFPDNTRVDVSFVVNWSAQIGKYSLIFTNATFRDSKNEIIPNTKNSLIEYINGGGNLEEKGDVNAIKEHINLMFQGNVQYIGFGEDIVGEGRVEILDCRIEERDNKQVVACYPS